MPSCSSSRLREHRHVVGFRLRVINRFEPGQYMGQLGGVLVIDLGDALPDLNDRVGVRQKDHRAQPAVTSLKLRS